MSNEKDFWKEYENVLTHGVPDLGGAVSEDGFVTEGSELKEYVGTAVNVVVPDGVTTIGTGAFFGCETVKTIWLPKSVTSIGPGAFGGCIKLKTVNLPDQIDLLDDETFAGCKKLQDVVLPAKLKRIGVQAFHYCISLKQIVIPEGVEVIDKEAFRKCRKLEKVIIQGTPKLDKDSFRQSDALLVTCKLPIAQISGIHLKHKVVLGWIGNDPKKVPIDDTVSAGIKKYMRNIFDEIVEAANANRQLLVQLIDRQILDIDQIDTLLNRFSGEPEVVAALLSLKNKMYTSADVEKNDEKKQEKLFRKPTAAELKKLWAIKELDDGSIKLVTYKGTEVNIVVPDMIGKKPVSTIGKECFGETLWYGGGYKEIPNRDERKKIETIEIPEGITLVEFRAFYGCTNLKSVIIPESVTSIGGQAFYGCKNLTSVIIPESVTSIGYAAFVGCYKLIVHAPAGSYAETYAKENNIPFVAE